MKLIKHTYIILLILHGAFLHAQSFEGTFYASYGGTHSDTYEFRKDGTCKLTYTGDYGTASNGGNYSIKGDTIYFYLPQEVPSSKEQRTVSEKFLLDKDSMLINIRTRMDFILIERQGCDKYSPRRRNIKYPQTKSADKNVRADLEKVINLAFNSDSIKNYLKTMDPDKRKLIIADYDEMQANIKVDTLTAVFKSLKNIKAPLYFEIEDINQNEEDVEIRIVVHDKRLKYNEWYWYWGFKKNGAWQLYQQK